MNHTHFHLKFSVVFTLTLLLFASSSYANGDPATARFSFDACSANFNTGTQTDYSEFIADITNRENVSLQVVGDNLYRNNPAENGHSCTAGLNGTSAMCVSADDECYYQAGNESSVRFDIKLFPTGNRFVKLSKLDFFELAPEVFSWNDGFTAPNNYPTRYGMRVIKNGTVIFQQADIPTTQEWSLESFNFENYPDFKVNEITTFNFELYAYCPIGAYAVQKVWDLEDLIVTAICTDEKIVDGGEITGGPFTFCVDDQADFLPAIGRFNTLGPNINWVVTDENNNILGLPNSPSDVDFNAAGIGTCYLWSLAYQDGLVGLTIGANTNNLNGIFDLSNSIQVNRTSPAGGTLSTPSAYSFCIDGQADMISDLSLSGNTGSNSSWVITDSSGSILGLPTNIEEVDFDAAGGGTCFIWNLSYEQGLTGLQVGASVDNLSGCFDFSNAVSVERTSVSGGSLSGGPFEFCVDGVSDFVAGLTLNNETGTNSSWIITDENGVILSLPNNIEQKDFEDIDSEICLIYNVSYLAGLSGLTINSNIADLEGCLGLSNSIQVNKLAPDGGVLSGGPYNFCIDGQADFVTDLALTGNVGTASDWLVIDNTNTVFAITTDISTVNFDALEGGNYFIANISSVGELEDLVLGGSIDDIEGCFSLSQQIIVRRFEITGGTLTGGPFDFCVDESSDFVSGVSVSGNNGNNTAWVIADEQGEVIGLPDTLETVDFNSAGPGICLIYSISSDEEINLEIGDNLSELEGCTGLSSNFVQVNRTGLNAGTLSGGPFEFCVDGTPDMVSSIILTAMGESNSTYVITDENEMILGITTEIDTIDFDAAGAGVCLIWNIAFGDDTEGLEVNENLSDITGCFGISNSIAVTRTIVNGGTLSGGPFNFCIDGVIDTVQNIVLMNATGENNTLIVTDTLGQIIGLPADIEAVNFDAVGSGVCYIVNLSFQTGISGLEVGENTSDLEGCFSLSNNIIVNRGEAEGGTLTGGPFQFTIDSEMDTVSNLSLAGNIGMNTSWIVTDTLGEILGLPADIEDVDFNAAGPGVCLIWSITFVDGLQGLEVGENASDLAGCFDLSNSITVTRIGSSAGSLAGGPFNFCIDGDEDMVSGITLTGNSGTNSQWIVTTDQDSIIGLPANIEEVDFNAAGAGTCYIYHLSHENDLTGLELNNHINELGGTFAITNNLTVNRAEPIGGTLTGGPFEFMVDGIQDTVTNVTLTGNAGTANAWVVTDENFIILGLPADIGDVDFDAAGPGVCLIWNISFEPGLTGLTVGESTSNIEGCFELSNNITVTRTQDMSALVIGGGPFTFCVDGTSDMVDGISITGDTLTNTQWVITTLQDSIIGLPTDVEAVDFNAAGEGVCLIYYLSYETGTTGITIDSSLNDLTGTFTLSNSISVTRTLPEGGSLAGGPFNFEVDGQADMVSGVSLSGASGANTAWVVTDQDGIILGLPMNIEDVNFDDAGVGVCLIWNLSYEDGLTGLELGQNTSGLAGCFALSNNITVTRTAPMTGLSISGGPFTFCVDGTVDMVDGIAISGDTLTNTQWVITTAQDSIIGLPDEIGAVDFDAAGAGVCLIYYLTYEDGAMGITIDSSLNDLSGTFTLSNNITVTRNLTEGGILTGGPFNFIIDGQADMVSGIELMGAAGSNTAWVVTDEDGLILGLPDDIEDVDFNAAGVGVCLIWSLSYEDGLTGLNVDQNTSDLSGCFTLSNSITVTRTDAFESVLTGGPFEFCIDGVADNVFGLNVTGNNGSNNDWVITDDQNTIISLPFNIETVNFDDAEVGVCNIYNISYGTGLTGLEIGNMLSDIQGNFSLTNSVTVTRYIPSGGTVSGGTYDFCIDGNDDFITDATVTGNTGEFSTWVITDVLRNIIGMNDTLSNVNFDTAGPGVCVVWNVSYGTGISGLDVDENLNDLVGCFEISADSLLVNRTEVNGGVIAEGPFNFCVDGEMDTIPTLTLSGNIGTNNSWVLTDVDGTILALPDNPSSIDFDAAGPGICLFWNLAFEDGLTGLNTNMNVSNLEGCFNFSESVEINRVQTSGGAIIGADTLFFQIDGVSDFVTGLSIESSSGSNQQWVITNQSGEILGLPDDISMVDFDNAGIGTCLIWNLGHEDGILGLEVGEVISELEGCFGFSNSIVVVRTPSIGGVLTGGPFSFCVDDEEDLVSGITLTENSGTNTQWIITNESGMILSLPNDITQRDFNTFGIGVCSIYSLSYEDGLTGLTVGNNISDLSGTYGLSNSIEVNRSQATAATLTGGPFSFCIDEEADLVSGLTLTGGDGDNSTWLIADVSGNILGLTAEIDTIDFNAISGVSLIYNLNYIDGLSGLEIDMNINGLSGCFGLSESVMVTTTELSGGTLTGGPFNFCIDDESDFLSNISLTGVIGPNVNFIATDEQGEILSIVDNLPEIDFNEAGAGTCFVYSIAYEDNLTGFIAGNNLSSLIGCFNLSDSLVVSRVEPLAGNIVGNDLAICIDGTPDFVTDLTISGGVGPNQVWIITDIAGEIIAIQDSLELFDFDETPAGVSLIHHISYQTGVMGLAVGELVEDISGCFDITNENISVIKTEPLGGSINPTSFQFCIDGLDDFAIGITVSDTVGTNKDWIVTDAMGIILDIPTDIEAVNFEDAGIGTCFIYHIAYADGLTGLEVDSNISGLMGCFDLSNNVEVTREDCVLMTSDSIVINEINSDDRVELKNVGTTTIDISEYSLYQFPFQGALAQLGIECTTDLILDPGEKVVIATNINLSGNDGELALLKDNQIPSNDNIIDYVQWGSSNHMSQSSAVAAGIWTSGEFVPSFSNNNSLLYDGFGNGALDWNEGNSSFCLENLIEPNEEQALRYQLNPNPARDFLEVIFENNPSEITSVRVYSAYGKLVLENEYKMDNEEKLQMDITNLKDGAYIFIVSAGNKSTSKRFIKIN